MVSFVHRVLLQWWWGATLGRALFAQRCVVTATGAKPSLGALLKTWLVLGFFAVFSTLGGQTPGHDHPVDDIAVRRGDARTALVLAAQARLPEAEYIAFGVGQDVPGLLSGLAEVGRARPELQEAFEFGVLIAVRGVDVEAQPLPRLGLDSGAEHQSRLQSSEPFPRPDLHRTFVGVEHAEPQHLAPERRQPLRIQALHSQLRNATSHDRHPTGLRPQAARRGQARPAQPVTGAPARAVQTATREGVDLLVLDQGIDTSTAAGRMFFQIVGSNAAFEQALRSERAVDSLAEARARAHWWAEAEARGSPGAAGQAQVRGVR